jgi:hypothetical protein
MPLHHPARSLRLPRPAAVLITLALAAAMPVPSAGAWQEATEDPWRVSDEEIERARNAPLFASSDVLEFTLTAEFDRISKEDRGEDPQERPATLTFMGSDGEVTVELKLQTRGNWRRQRRNCDFPPLWLDLDKDDPALPGTVFESQNRLKLYVTCQKGRDTYEQYILQEYLVYPTYNLLTDLSFRARPVYVHYVDSEKPDESFSRHAFLLEHKSAMAARNRAVPLEAPQVHPAQMSGEDAAFLSIFNYMIGMTDWTAVFMHNVEAIRLMDDGRVVPVGYDFDWSGLVNTRYAVPAEQLPIRNVRQRIYQGFCRDLDYDPIFQRFLDRREDILALWRNFALLEEDRRKDAVDFLDEFFERIGDPGRRSRLLRDCTPIPR